jgi:hypothetical protein
MKKLIASLLVLVFGATMVLAEAPAANAPQVVPCAFADVEGLDLNEVEEQNVIGKGPLAGAVGGAILGAVSGGVYESVRTAYRMVTKKEDRNTNQIRQDIITNMKSGAIQGAVLGAMMPSF